MYLFQLKSTKDQYVIVLKRKDKRIASISSWRKTIIDPYVKGIIKKNVKYWKGKQIFICEEDGVKLVVLFKTIGSLQNMREVDKIFLYVKSMRRETVYLWYSKILTNNKNIIKLRNVILK